MRKLLCAIIGLLFTIPSWALPAGYTELEYIESTGTQYIDTGVAPNQNYDAELVAQLTQSSGGEILMGSRITFNSRGFTIVGHSGGTYWASGYGTQSGVTSVATDLDKHTFRKTPTNFYIDGESLYTYTNETFTTPGNLYLFGSNNNGTFGLPSKLKVWSLKLYNNGTLVRDFVPAKNSSNVVGMYDTVNNRFYTNAGTGEFIAGDPVTDNPCRNLFDKTNYTEINAFVNANTGVLTSGSSGSATQYSAVIPCKPNTTYTISGRGISSWGAFTSSDVGTTATSFSKVENGSITTGANDRYLIGLIRANSNTIDYRNDLQIEEGSTATPYVPYDPQCATCNGTIVNYVSATGTGVQNGTPTPTNPIEPTFYTQGDMVLRKVGDYADSYDATTGKITRRVGVKALDGTETWSYNEAYSRFVTSLSDLLDANARTLPFVCTHCQATRSSETNPGYIYNATNQRIMITDSHTTVGDWKQWLAQQYAAGTPVTVWYPLETETTEDWPASQCTTEPIKIATTKYNETAFGPLNTALANAISVVDTVVSNTITQAGKIATLQAQKQTRPADDTCPAYKQCLLVEDEQGVPHWYEITDPFRDFVAPIIANNVAPASTTNSAGYTQLEYIESTGTQWIDTGIVGNMGIAAEIKLSISDAKTSWILGSRTGTDKRFGAIILSDTWDLGLNTDNVFGQYVVERDYVINFVTNLNTPSTMSINNGDSIAVSQVNNTDLQLYLFNVNYNGTPTSGQSFIGKIYYSKIWNNGALVRNFVPVKRNIDGAIGMYDTVTKTFFANAGTGTFTAGPVVANDADVPGATWTATWAADATTGVSASTVYGEGLCNAVAGTTVGEIATDAQMNSSDWSNNGTYCRCKIDGINTNGSDVDTTTNKWVWLTSTSSCLEKCAYYCSNSTKTATEFRNIMLNTAQ